MRSSRSKILAGVAGLMMLAGGLLGSSPAGIQASSSMLVRGGGSGPAPADVPDTAGSSMPGAAAATTYRHYQGRYFAALLPPGWLVTGETRNGIDIVGPGQVAAVTFGYVTGYAPGTVTAQSFQDSAFGATGLRITRVVSSRRIRAFTTGPGVTWTGRVTEFEGLYRGQRVHGVVTVQVGHTASADAAMIYVRVARANKYAALSPVLITIQRSITVVRTR